jgi:hypothetical protein
MFKKCIFEFIFEIKENDALNRSHLIYIEHSLKVIFKERRATQYAFEA